MTSAELLIRCLENENVDLLFALPGEETLELFDALRDSSIRLIITRHEQGAAFMADVYGRCTDKAGVCLATLGPGATNLLTGVADATLDHAPLVAITGQASLSQRHKESHQYIDVMSMFKPVTKWQAEIALPAIVAETVRKAFKVAGTEKPGATHLELPQDVASASVGGEAAMPLRVQSPVVPEPLGSQVQRATHVLGTAHRPILLAGNGVIRRRAYMAVREFARALNVPVVETFMAKGVIPDNDPFALSTVGLRMRDFPLVALEKADIVIAVGYDFVEYAPCFWNPNRDKRIIHVDVSPAEVDAHYIVEVGILGDVGLSLEHIRTSLQPFDANWATSQRKALLDARATEFSDLDAWPPRPQTIIHELRAVIAPHDRVICDVGAHKLWMARLFPCEEPNTCIISNGFAAMGIAVPGAIAAKLAFPDQRVVAVCGDGGFLMNVQELETAVRYGIPIVILVWRDNGYGVIRWNQLTRFGRTHGVDFGNPDLVKLAESFGALGFRPQARGELRACLLAAFETGVPAVIDCPVDYGENQRLTTRLLSLN